MDGLDPVGPLDRALPCVPVSARYRPQHRRAARRLGSAVFILAACAVAEAARAGLGAAFLGSDASAGGRWRAAETRPAGVPAAGQPFAEDGMKLAPAVRGIEYPRADKANVIAHGRFRQVAAVAGHEFDDEPVVVLDEVHRIDEAPVRPLEQHEDMDVPVLLVLGADDGAGRLLTRPGHDEPLRVPNPDQGSSRRRATWPR
jgi:hypothetical protein